MGTEHEFTVKGQRIRTTREGVEAALQGVRPDRIQRHAVEVGGRRYPVKQAFAIAFGMSRTDFNTGTARDIFLRMGFPVLGPPPEGQQPEPDDRPPARPEWADSEIGSGEEQTLEVGAIWLIWSHWYWWDELEEDLRDGRRGPRLFAVPGVYEVRRHEEQERLVIGKSSNLRQRVRDAFVKGAIGHAAGAKIREKEDTRWLLVRWAEAERPAAAEEELHRLHVARFGHLPAYTLQT